MYLFQCLCMSVYMNINWVGPRTLYKLANGIGCFVDCEVAEALAVEHQSIYPKRTKFLPIIISMTTFLNQGLNIGNNEDFCGISDGNINDCKQKYDYPQCFWCNDIVKK